MEEEEPPQQQWTRFYRYTIPFRLWPVFTRPGNWPDLIRRLDREYGFTYIQRQWPQVTPEIYQTIREAAIQALRLRAQAFLYAQERYRQEDPIERSQTAIDWRRREALPFQELDDRAFMAILPPRFPSVVTRLQTATALQVVQEERVAEVLGRRYQESWRYTLTFNTFDLLQNMRLIYERMTVHVLPQSRVRVRMVYQDRMRLLQNFSRARRLMGLTRGEARPQIRTTRVYNGLEEWLDPETLQNLQETVSQMFVSNESLDLFQMEFFLDVANPTAGRGGEGSGRPSNQVVDQDLLKQDFPAFQHFDGMVLIPKEANPHCGWFALAFHVAYFMPLTDPACFPGWAALFPRKASHKDGNGPKYRANVLLKSLAHWKKAALLLKQYCEGQSPMVCPDDLHLFLAKFPLYRVVVLNYATLNIQQVLEGDAWSLNDLNDGDQGHTLYLIWDRFIQHYHIVRSMQTYGARGKKTGFWCHGCLTFVSKKEHECQVEKCPGCQLFFTSEEHKLHHLTPDGSHATCDKCGAPFPNQTCLANHSHACVGGAEPCPDCGQAVRPQYRQSHHCGQRFCRQCYKHYPITDTHHQCVLQPVRFKRLTSKMKDAEQQMELMYAFDFESMFLPGPTLERVLNDGTPMTYETQQHVVNFVAVQQLGTGERWQFDTIEAFIHWALQLPRRDNEDAERSHAIKHRFVAHNLKGYDGRLLFDYLVKEYQQGPQRSVWTGTKLMSFALEHLYFMDSLCHIQAALAEFPKIFGLDPNKYKKGFFPYKFNTPEHQSYVGPIPARHYFDPDGMTPAKKKQFEQWYQQQTGSYDFQKQLKEYCISDVAILAEALEVYLREGMEYNNGLNPLQKLTIASYAKTVFMHSHYSEVKTPIFKLDEQSANFARKSLHGGRTDVRRMLRFWSETELAQGKCGKYQDVQSLYPTVQFYDPLPIGAPHRVDYVDEEGFWNIRPQPTMVELQTFFGFIECDITPTRYLFHPLIVDVSEQHKKLTADLHPKKKVVLTSVELQEALKHGYVVNRVYRIDHYQPSTEIFKPYIRHFLKLKLESSGLPGWIKTELDWKEFAQKHEEDFGITLERDKMIKNPGKKQLAKLMLNSLWGKFAERDRYVMYALCDDVAYSSLDILWDSGDIDILNTEVLPNGQIMCWYMDYRPKRLSKAENNVALASFVTAHGRLRLWKELHQLGERVLYHDTDSIVYDYDPALYNIPVGRYLGEWEDETENQPITAFVSIGPKTYSYQYRKPMNPKDVESYRAEDRTVVEVDGQFYEQVYQCKAKGFTLNARNLDRINFDGMWRLLRGDTDYLKSITTKFVYDRQKHTMITYAEHKCLGWAYNKGEIAADYTVLPYGYERFRRRVALLKRRHHS